MRIGIYLPFLESESGGGYTFATTILQVLYATKTEHQFTVFHYGQETPDTYGVKFVPLVKSRLTSFAPSRFKKDQVAKSPLDKAAKLHHIDLVWFITPSYEKTDLPFVVTVWDLQHRLQPFFPEVSALGWSWAARESHYDYALPRATFVVTGTKVGAEEVNELYRIPLERIRVLPQPTPEFALKNKVSQKSGLKLPKRYIFYPAQFWSHKNHVGLLQALKIANDELKLDIHLVLSGSDKGNLSYIKEVADSLGVSKYVHYLGFISEVELIYVYQNALALVFVTFFGPDNLPPLEAFALGCPVIASRVHGSEEQLGEAAILVDPTDQRAIAEAINRVASDPSLRNRLVASGKKRAQSWTSEDYVKGIMKVISEFEPYRRTWQ
jgi:glycosyltransferase involved in cell wall biosynthesis